MTASSRHDEAWRQIRLGTDRTAPSRHARLPDHPRGEGEWHQRRGCAGGGFAPRSPLTTVGHEAGAPVSAVMQAAGRRLRRMGTGRPDASGSHEGTAAAVRAGRCRRCGGTGERAGAHDKAPRPLGREVPVGLPSEHPRPGSDKPMVIQAALRTPLDAFQERDPRGAGPGLCRRPASSRRIMVV